MYYANRILANPYLTLIVIISILILSYLTKLYGNAYLLYPNLTLSTPPYNNRSMSATSCCCVMLITPRRGRDRRRDRCKGRGGSKGWNGHVRRSKSHKQACSLLRCDHYVVHPSSPGRRNDCDRSRMFFSGGVCGVGGRFDACKGWYDTFVCTWCNS